MVNKSRLSGEIDNQELSWATTTMAYSYSGGKVTIAQAAATTTLLNAIPKDRLGELDRLSMLNDQNTKLKQFMSDLIQSNPTVKEKFLDVIDTNDPQWIAAQKAPKDLPVQQQQAYLKLLGYDIGKTGLDGIAGKGSNTQKALDQFAKENGVDPKDKARVNQVLFGAALTCLPKNLGTNMAKEIEAGKLSPEDIKIVKWILKGAGSNMNASLRDGKMDAVANSETKKALNEVGDIYRKLVPPPPMSGETRNMHTRLVAGERSVGRDDPMQLFKENLREMLKPLTDIVAEIGEMIKKEVHHMAEDAGLKAGLSGEFGRAVSAMGGMEDKVQRRDLFKEPATAPVQTGIKPT